jgi:hypothetical protein
MLRVAEASTITAKDYFVPSPESREALLYKVLDLPKQLQIRRDHLFYGDRPGYFSANRVNI